MNTAIIVAAGSGTRFGGEVPKQFVEILGKPVVIHTLARFESCAAVDRIILVVPPDQVEPFDSISWEYGFRKLSKIIAGGPTRARSVRNALDQVDPRDAGVIAVHDGARPLVASAEIAAVIARAEETGAACLVAKVNETIKEISGDRIARTIDRDKLRRALTPQCFKFDIIRKAYDQPDSSDEASDDCLLVEKLGFPISFVEGDAKNIKITTPGDIAVAEALLRIELAAGSAIEAGK